MFVNFYYDNELKRLVNDKSVKQVLRAISSIDEERDAYQTRFTDKLFNLVNRVNELFSWNMLKHNNLLFSQRTAEKILEDNEFMLK